MKTTSLTLTLCALTFGIFNQSFAMQAPAQPETPSLLERIPSPYQVARYGYYAANLAAWGLVIYVGYKAYTNENLAKAVGKLYNLATSGDTITPEERQAIKVQKAKKYKDLEDTAAAVQQHTLLLGTLNTRTLTIESTMELLRKASEQFATKADIKRLEEKIDRVLEQTRTGALAEGFLAARSQ